MKNNNPLSVMIINLIVLTFPVLGCPSVTEDPRRQGVENEVQRLVNCKPSQDYSNLTEFQFNPRIVPVDDSTCLSLRMFKEMGFVQQFNIPLEKLSRFILLAQRGYRQVPYHNWDHGFSVLHFSFAVLKNCNYIENNRFTPLEGLALLTAAMCHDLDHPGTNNKYQERTDSGVGREYMGKGSLLERHHIEKTFDILKIPDANFAAHLPDSEYRQFEYIIRQIILATDLTTHFKILQEEQQMASEGFNWLNERHRHLLRSVVISSADLSDQTRDWSTVRRIAKLINTEFFNQGDKEKEMGIVPEKIMNRKEINIADNQAKFFSKVLKPLFSVLATMCPAAGVCNESLEQNLQFWQRAAPHFREQSATGRGQLDILDDSELDHIPTVLRNKRK